MNTTKLASMAGLGIAACLLAPLARADFYVTQNDTVNLIGSIARTDDLGNVTQTFGEGVLSYPISIAFQGGLLYVADYLQGRVQKFTANGLYLGEFAGGMNTIASLLFLPDGTLLVAAYEGGPIHRFDADGTQMADFVADTGLVRHGQMAVDASGNVYVCSWIEQVVQQYDPAGNFLGDFANAGTTGIGSVTSLLFDAAGNLFMAEFLTGRLLMLDPTGTVLTELGTASSEPEYLSWTPSGELAVPRFFGNAVHLHDPDGTDLGAFANVLGPYHMEYGPEVVVPNSVTLVRGRHNAGTVADLAVTDGSVYRVCRFIVPNQSDPPIQVTVRGTAANLTPSGMTVTMVSKMNTSGLFGQTLILIDANGVLSATERRTDNLGTTQTTVHLSPSVASDFVAPDGTVAIRYFVRQTGPAAAAIWCHEADEVSWTLVP